MAALAPHAGHAQVVGITGSPGVGKSTSTSALVTELRSAGQAGRRPRRRPLVAVLRRGAARRPGPDAGPRHSTATSTSARWPRAVTSAGSPGRRPQALRVLDAAGCDVILVETVGVGQSEVEIAGLADTTLVLLAPGMGDGIQAAKAGHPRDRRRLRRQQGRPRRRRPGAPRPAVHAGARRAGRGRLEAADRQDRRRPGARGSTRSSPRSTSTARGSRRAASSSRRRTRRARDEIEAIAVTALRARWGDVHGRSELDDLAAGGGGRDLRPLHRRGHPAGGLHGLSRSPLTGGPWRA